MPLKIIIVGAGLGGLGCAIALTRAGHKVEVFEQSSFLNEVGAAIHIPPNATRVLKHWDCDFEDLQATLCNAIKVYDKTGKLMFIPASTKALHEKLNTRDEWLLSHRVDLHNTLRKLATDETYGDNLKIRLSSRVMSADAEAAEIVLEDGTKHRADLLVGADGVHSKVVAAVTQKTPERKSTGQNTFRFLVPMDKIQANPLTRRLFANLGIDCQHVFVTYDRRLVIYPCRRGKLLNIVAMHPAEDSSLESESSWLAGGKIEDLLNTYSEFSPDIIEMCSLAEDLKLWSLATRDPPRSDAAHPMLPHQGQGGAQSLEDGAALGALFPADTTVDQIPRRLALFNKLRYGRAVTVMFMSKINDERRGEMMDDLRKFVPDAQLPKSMFEYAWDSYVVRDAQQLLANETKA
ncbi:monooxygenase [Dactylonectria estremocensis]|uniref:Monooxygenase n=1 Tax=Dactylonectria estremocensis TaxID=1079267 RepID=A0A9P9D587_9HYPO|nr:monooxygenase [Dactylonectria estremocensis]